MLRFKLYQVPKGSEFVFNGVTFVRGDYLPASEHYRCTAKKGGFCIILHKFTYVQAPLDE